ncbi:MAG: ethanolamine ammonia-lyase reactivating factor EutA [Acidaminococcales bacterium]|jgi:ethanolamine utilization protein EutA|nr:ethanolamine ammonia-lyase reactivating factor EutA [Acidaminococcales bacterium]
MPALAEDILSVGIDIGTSTVQLVFSRLTLANAASAFAVPKIAIVEKTLIYKSAVYFTPLASPTEIDAPALCWIVSAEYDRAGVKAEEVTTGAVIITGDTARKSNAAEVLRLMGNLAGEFVVVTAGPDLESVLSGRGAGAGRLSGRENATVANLDIGGGTTNISIFRNGELLAVTCLDIGGRLIKITEGRISYICGKMQFLADRYRLPVKEGAKADAAALRELCAALVKMLEGLFGLREKDDVLPMLFTGGAKDMQNAFPVDIVTFSGGVAECIYQNGPDNPFAFDDVGVLLAQEMRKSLFYDKLRVFCPDETIRATVAGAGMYATQISGSTVAFDRSVLPVKNIPILKLSAAEEEKGSIVGAIKKKASFYKTPDGFAHFALALSGGGYFHFLDIQKLAALLLSAMGEALTPEFPLTVILEKDIAQALGNAIRVKAPGRSLVCIDGITPGEGDYIDIGAPVGGGRVLPVVIKTLVFNR